MALTKTEAAAKAAPTCRVCHGQGWLWYRKQGTAPWQGNCYLCVGPNTDKPYWDIEKYE